MAVVLVFLNKYKKAESLLQNCLNTLPTSRHYLIHAIRAKIFEFKNDCASARDQLLKALHATENEVEKKLITHRINSLSISN